MPEPADPLSVPCAACLAPPGEPCYSVSSDEPRPAPHRLRSLAAAQHLRRCPMCAAVGWVSAQSDEPTGDLRDRIAETLPCPVCPAQAGTPCVRAREDNQQPHMSRRLRADAVLPVVEAETAALRQRAEEAERERDDYRQRFANQMTAATELTTTLREAERKLQQALEAIADERRGRLAAVERVRRMAQVWVDIRPQHPTATTDAHTLAWAGEQIIAALDQTEETPPAEHTGGNAEDCPVCAPLIDQPGGVLYPWICTAAGEQVIAALPEQAAGPPPG